MTERKSYKVIDEDELRRLVGFFVCWHYNRNKYLGFVGKIKKDLKAVGVYTGDLVGRQSSLSEIVRDVYDEVREKDVKKRAEGSIANLRASQQGAELDGEESNFNIGEASGAVRVSRSRRNADGDYYQA